MSSIKSAALFIGVVVAIATTTTATTPSSASRLRGNRVIPTNDTFDSDDYGEHNAKNPLSPLRGTTQEKGRFLADDEDNNEDNNDTLSETERKRNRRQRRRERRRWKRQNKKNTAGGDLDPQEQQQQDTNSDLAPFRVAQLDPTASKPPIEQPKIAVNQEAPSEPEQPNPITNEDEESSPLSSDRQAELDVVSVGSEAPLQVVGAGGILSLNKEDLKAIASEPPISIETPLVTKPSGREDLVWDDEEDEYDEMIGSEEPIYTRPSYEDLGDNIIDNQLHQDLLSRGGINDEPFVGAKGPLAALDVFQSKRNVNDEPVVGAEAPLNTDNELLEDLLLRDDVSNEPVVGAEAPLDVLDGYRDVNDQPVIGSEAPLNTNDPLLQDLLLKDGVNDEPVVGAEAPLDVLDAYRNSNSNVNDQPVVGAEAPLEGIEETTSVPVSTRPSIQGLQQTSLESEVNDISFNNGPVNVLQKAVETSDGKLASFKKNISLVQRSSNSDESFLFAEASAPPPKKSSKNNRAADRGAEKPKKEAPKKESPPSLPTSETTKAPVSKSPVSKKGPRGESTKSPEPKSLEGVSTEAPSQRSETSSKKTTDKSGSIVSGFGKSGGGKSGSKKSGKSGTGKSGSKKSGCAGKSGSKSGSGKSGSKSGSGKSGSGKSGSGKSGSRKSSGGKTGTSRDSSSRGKTGSRKSSTGKTGTGKSSEVEEPSPRNEEDDDECTDPPIQKPKRRRKKKKRTPEILVEAPNVSPPESPEVPEEQVLDPEIDSPEVPPPKSPEVPEEQVSDPDIEVKKNLIVTEETPAPTSITSLESTIEPFITGQTDPPIIVGCPGDVKLHHQKGTTTVSPDDPILDAITIVKQETSTVTVSLNQVWTGNTGEVLDAIFYYYNVPGTNFWGSAKCYEQADVPFAENSPFETIEIACNVLQPTAELKVCIVDDADKGIFNPPPSLEFENPSSLVPKCCYPEDDPNKKQTTVCYTLVIRCTPDNCV